MFPTKILVAVDGFRGMSSTVRAAVELASGTGSELHVVHVVPTVPELPYLHLAAKERVENFFEWRRLKGFELLDDQVRRIGEDLGGSVAASYYREGKPEKELVLLGKEIDAGLIMMGARGKRGSSGYSGLTSRKRFSAVRAARSGSWRIGSLG